MSVRCQGFQRSTGFGGNEKERVRRVDHIGHALYPVRHGGVQHNELGVARSAAEGTA